MDILSISLPSGTAASYLSLAPTTLPTGWPWFYYMGLVSTRRHGSLRWNTSSILHRVVTGLWRYEKLGRSNVPTMVLQRNLTNQYSNSLLFVIIVCGLIGHVSSWALFMVFGSYLWKICNCSTSFSFSGVWRGSKGRFQKKKSGWDRSFIGRRIHVSLIRPRMSFESADDTSLRTILQSIEPVIRFSSIILVEPMLSPGGQEPVYLLREKLVKSAYERRDVWPSREKALQSLKSNTRWHPRVQELFIVSLPQNWT
jgi:hypothetical protein